MDARSDISLRVDFGETSISLDEESAPLQSVLLDKIDLRGVYSLHRVSYALKITFGHALKQNVIWGISTDPDAIASTVTEMHLVAEPSADEEIEHNLSVLRDVDLEGPIPLYLIAQVGGDPKAKNPWNVEDKSLVTLSGSVDLALRRVADHKPDKPARTIVDRPAEFRAPVRCTDALSSRIVNVSEALVVTGSVQRAGSLCVVPAAAHVVGQKDTKIPISGSELHTTYLPVKTEKERTADVFLEAGDIAGREIRLVNVGDHPLGVDGAAVPPGRFRDFIWTGEEWFAAA